MVKKQQVEPFYKQLGKRIRARRRELDITQWQLADELGTTNSSVCYIERGQRRFHPHQLDTIARFLQTTPNDLMGFEP